MASASTNPNPDNDQSNITLEQGDGRPRANIAETIQLYSDVLEQSPGEPTLVKPASCACTKYKEDLKELLKRIKNGPDDHFPRKVYPKRTVYNLLQVNDIKRLLRCPCSNCRCDNTLQPPRDEVVDIITSQYRLILAILLLMGRVYLLQGFVDKNYTDEMVLQEPPSEGDLEDLAVEFRSKREIPIAFHDPHFPSEFHFDFQPQFILPDLPAHGSATTFTGKCSLPLGLEECIGRGGYGDVYKAVVLDGYHSYETESGYVAVKIYRESTTEGGRNQAEGQSSSSCCGNDEDFQAEKKNNERFHHPNIIPMLAAIKHGVYNMTIYPLARTSLENLMREQCTLSLADIVSRMADLFSALALMHRGVPETCGYHFDIKPANILVRYDNTWVLADLGAAYFKKPVIDDPSYSATKTRPPCADEFAAPDGEPFHRSFDVWSLGCVFSLLLVWFAEGSDAVTGFRNSRGKQTGNKISYSFHEVVEGEPVVKLAVSEKFATLTEQRADNRLLIESLKIVRLLLSPEQAERPTSGKAEYLLRGLLGEGGGEGNAPTEVCAPRRD